MEGFQECERDETERRTGTLSWVPLLLSGWSLIRKFLLLSWFGDLRAKMHQF